MERAFLPPVHVISLRQIHTLEQFCSSVCTWMAPVTHWDATIRGRYWPTVLFLYYNWIQRQQACNNSSRICVNQVSGCLFCDHIDLEVLIKLRIYRRTVKEAVSSDELLHDTNLIIVKRHYLNCQLWRFYTFSRYLQNNSSKEQKRRISFSRQ